MWKQAELFGDAYPGETPQAEENWQEAAPSPGIPWPDMDPAMWYRINGENVDIAPLPLGRGSQPIYVHQGTAYVDSDHSGLVEWAGDSGLKLAYTPMRLPNSPPFVYRIPPPIPEDKVRPWGYQSDHPTQDALFYNPEQRMVFVAPQGGHHSDVARRVPKPFMGDNALAGYINHAHEWSGEPYEHPQFDPSPAGWHGGSWAPEDIQHVMMALERHYPGIQLSDPYDRYPDLDVPRPASTEPAPYEPVLSTWHLAEYPGGGQMADKIKRQQDIEMFNRGDPDWQPPKVDLDFEPRGPFACSQCDYKPTSIADYRMHVEYEHTPHDAEEIQDGHFPQIDDFDEPLPLRRTQPKPNGGETVAGVNKEALHVIRLLNDRPCRNFAQFDLYARLAGFDTPTTVYYGAYEDGELAGYGVVREDEEPEVMMIQAKEHGRGIGTAILRRIKRDYDRFYTHADSRAGERLMTREGMVNVRGHLWRYAKGKAPKDMLEQPVPFVFDIPKDRLVLGYPGYDTHDVRHPEGFSPGGIVEGTYEPGGKVTIWTATSWPFSVRHLMDLWKAQAPQMEVTGVEQKELDGSTVKLASMETQAIGPYMNALVQSSPAASNAYKALSAAGGEVWVVGGPNRDYMQGRTPKDIDMLVRGLQPEEVLHTLRQLPGGVKLTGQRFGVFRYWSGRQGEDEVEIALPRTDQYEGGSRGKAQITVDPELPIEKDLERRDFTANATATRLDDGKFVDPYNGAQDIQRGVLRTTHPNSFKEDPTRLVRALMAHGRFGLMPDERTRLEMRKYAHMLQHESPDALNKVLDKWMSSENPAAGVRLGHDTGVLKYLLPEVDKYWDYDQRNPYHNLPLGEHLVHTLDNVSRLTTDPDVRLAALLHDIGKPASQWVDENGVGHYYRVDTKDPNTGEVAESKGQYHESVGSKMADALMRRRFNWPAQRTTRIAELVRRHMFPPFSDDVGARKFMNKNHAYVDDLLHLREADQEGKGLPDEETAARTSPDYMRQLVEQQREMSAPVQQAAMAINGNDLLNLGMKPGPAVGQVLQSLTNAVVENPELNTREQLLDLAQQQIDALPLETRATASIKMGARDLMGTNPSTQAAMAHTGQIPGDERLMGDVQVEQPNPHSGVNPSFTGTVNGAPVFIKTEGAIHDNDLANERASFAVAHAMGIRMPHTVIRQTSIPAFQHPFTGEVHPGGEYTTQVQHAIPGARPAMNYYGTDVRPADRHRLAAEEFPDQYRQMALLDNVIGNQDRHMGNMIVAHYPNGERDLYPIDHGGAYQTGPRHYTYGPNDHMAMQDLTPLDLLALRAARAVPVEDMGISPYEAACSRARIDHMLNTGKFLPLRGEYPPADVE